MTSKLRNISAYIVYLIVMSIFRKIIAEANERSDRIEKILIFKLLKVEFYFEKYLVGYSPPKK